MLRTAVAEAIENARLVTAPNQTRLEWPGEDLADIGHAVAVSAYELLTRPSCPGLNTVPDATGSSSTNQNGSRRWCSMADCGTHAKMRRYVARRAAQRNSGRDDHLPAAETAWAAS